MDLSRLLAELLVNAAVTYLDEQVPSAPPPRRPAPQGRRIPQGTPQPRRVASPSAPLRRGKPVRSQSAVRRGSGGVPYVDKWIQLPRHEFEEVPKEIRQMRTISGYSVTGKRSMESLFVQQGRFMVDFCDEYEKYVPCSRTTPMYYNLKDDELRCYFTWRTKYKLGEHTETETAYLMLYASEILNQIGVTSPQDALERLKWLSADYGDKHPQLKKAVSRWLPDYAAYFGLPYDSRAPKDIALSVMLRHSRHSDLAVLSALNWLSKYKLLESKLYLAYKEDTAAALHRVYAAMLRHYAEKKHFSYPVFLFGDVKRAEHVMFEGAVFYDVRGEELKEEADIRLSPMTVYHCCRGKWAVERYCSDPDSAKIGAFLRTFDSLMRDQLGFKYSLKAGDLPTGDAEVIRQAIGAYFAEKARANAPKIELDAAKLAEIREAAAHTTDMLTLPEDEDVNALLNEAPEETESPENNTSADADTELPELPLSTPAMALLVCLLTGESYQPLTEKGHMLSVLADEINETLYDRFGDNVIEFEGDTPVIVPDYEEDLKGLFQS